METNEIKKTDEDTHLSLAAGLFIAIAILVVIVVIVVLVYFIAIIGKKLLLHYWNIIFSSKISIYAIINIDDNDSVIH